MYSINAFERTVLGIICTILCFFVVSLVLPHHAHAQLPSTADLAVSPLFPQPYSDITVSIEAYSMDTVGAAITWFVDGVEQTSFRNARSLTLKTGVLGKKISVSATVKMLNGPSFTVRRDIIPAAVDLILESDTYVPAFYRGRALPSGNASIRAIAIPHVGTSVSPSSFTYRWELGGGVLFGGPIRGKQSADVTMSRFANERLSVTVIDQNGVLVAQKTITLNPIEPELHFYEDNPLRGLHERAILGSLTLIGDETTVYAEPYYMNTDLTAESVDFAWSINGEETSYKNPDQHTITLRKSGGSGSALIELKTLTQTKIPQYLRDAFSIIF
jgi:hypothetical protein